MVSAGSILALEGYKGIYGQSLIKRFVRSFVINIGPSHLEKVADMAKQSKRPAKQANTSKKRSKAKEPESSAPAARRDVLRLIRNGALALAVVGAGGWYVVSEVRAGIEEADLSKIGNGIPTIVQIHDPQCPICQSLQREARAALEQFEDGELQYLVANIRQDKGRRFASQHEVPHVTLVLFNGAGERREILSGPSSSAELERAFRRHLESEAKS